MNNQLLYNYFYYKAYQLETPISVMIELLTKCNLRCEHCYLPSHDDAGLSFNTVKDLLYQLKDMGVVNISLTGGEIFLRSDLLEIISVARELKMRVFLLSNATLLSESMVKKLSELNIAEFSTTIFSLDEEVHDSITSQKGSLKKLLWGLELLKKYNIKVRLKTPLMCKNMYAYKEIEKFCQEEGYEYLTSALIFSKNNGDSSPKSLRIPQCEFCTVLKDIDKINRNKHLHEREVACASLRYSFAIDCKGNVYPCNSFLYKVGNIYVSSLKQIWYNSPDFIKIRNIKNEDLIVCKNCQYVGECDRCPGMVYMENKDFYSCDYFAKHMAQIRMSSDYKN